MKFTDIPVGTIFAVGGGNPNGTHCVKESNDSSYGDYGTYRFMDQRERPTPPYLMIGDCDVTVIVYPWQALPVNLPDRIIFNLMLDR